jgi:hypothetical protein
LSLIKKDVTRKLREEVSWRGSVIDQVEEFLDESEKGLTDKKKANNVVITDTLIEAIRVLVKDSRMHNQNIRHVINHELTVKKK